MMIGGYKLVCLGFLVRFISEVTSQCVQCDTMNSTCPLPKEGLPVDGPCGQRCICLDGRLEYCCRQREDFVSMTRIKRLRYVNAIVKASTQPQFKAEYDSIIATHKRLFNRGIHNRNQFLPWHRWFLLRFENLLRKVDCRLTLPYWDWSLFAGRPWRRGVDDIWSRRPWGLGGNGARGRGRDRCVRDGRFSAGRGWNTTSSAQGSCLRRRFSGTPPDIIAVYLTKEHTAQQFARFELNLRANLHDTVHCRVGGTMCAHDSANAPEFFLHHAFIDKIWADWQEQSTSHMRAYFPDRGGNVGMMETGFRSSDYIDTLDLPDPDAKNRDRWTCVIYKDPVHRVYDDIIQRLDTLSFHDIRQIPRHFFRPANRRQMRELGVERNERRAARRLLREELEPENRIRGDTTLTTALDRLLGFRLDSIPFNRRKKRPAKKTNRMHDRWFEKANSSRVLHTHKSA